MQKCFQERDIKNPLFIKYLPSKLQVKSIKKCNGYWHCHTGQDENISRWVETVVYAQYFMHNMQINLSFLGIKIERYYWDLYFHIIMMVIYLQSKSQNYSIMSGDP